MPEAEHTVPETDATLTDLDRQLDEWDVQYFSARYLCLLDDPDWRGPDIAVPPRKLWPNLRDTILLADRIRDAWGGPIKVTSGYRPPDYNNLVGGSQTSAHLKFRAMDIKPLHRFRLRPYFECVAEQVRRARDSGEIVGCGIYYGQHGRFVHIDTGHRGYQYDWSEPEDHSTIQAYCSKD